MRLHADTPTTHILGVVLQVSRVNPLLVTMTTILFVLSKLQMVILHAATNNAFTLLYMFRMKLL